MRMRATLGAALSAGLLLASAATAQDAMDWRRLTRDAVQMWGKVIKEKNIKAQ